MFAHMEVWFGICSLVCSTLPPHQTCTHLHISAYSVSWCGGGTHTVLISQQ